MYRGSEWLTLVLTLLFVLAGAPAMAGVSPGEAAKLGNTLTPFGAETAGNADGTIPAWEGGILSPPEGLGYKGPGDMHPDPFPGDKALFSITAHNLARYADNVSTGQTALLKKYPDTYRLDVYPTRRTHAAPQWVYDNTIRNAVRCRMTPDGLGIEGGYGGIPFPIPKRGEEVISNHLLRWMGEGMSGRYNGGMVRTSGVIARVGGADVIRLSPFHLTDGSPETHDGGLQYILPQYMDPPRRKGEVTLVLDMVNPVTRPRKAFQYLPGQRRVRRAPTIAYDTPNPAFSGLTTYDDNQLFNGALDRYDWKIIGKREMYIPYNCYQIDQPGLEEKAVFTPYHMNPDYIRWELHRVWVVEATLKAGKRHSYFKRVFYQDEDSWVIACADIYDGRGKLWRTNHATLKNTYELPATQMRLKIYYDFTLEDYAFTDSNVGLSEHLRYERIPREMFTAAHVRRVGRR